MTAGAVLYMLHLASSWVHLAVSAIVDLIYFKKEGRTMERTTSRSEKCSWFQRTKKHVIVSWEAHLPFRHSLLMSP
jgi:hypothetical protein